jgi:hypothetical protein
LGRWHEAKEFARLAAETAPAEGVAEQALSRIAIAGAAIDAGDHREAERRAREAVALSPTEMCNLRADVLAELAAILRACGNERAAAEAVSGAARLYELKGNVVAAARLSVKA